MSTLRFLAEYLVSGAVFDQDSFRGRNDDGNETTATWIAAANADFSHDIDADPKFRIRFLIQETAGVAEADFSEQLQYNLNGAGWNNVTGASSVIRGVLSANYADGANTTQQIGAGTFIVTNAGMVEGDGGPASATAPDFAGSDETEFEFMLEIQAADVVNSDTIQLRVTKAGTALGTYTNTPTVTVTEAVAGRIMSSLVGAGGLVAAGGLAGEGGGLAG
jgi:hypothetical protein